ncbi:TPA: hypothetical protein ACSTJZ_001383 [Serratia fonticola]
MNYEDANLKDIFKSYYQNDGVDLSMQSKYLDSTLSDLDKIVSMAEVSYEQISKLKDNEFKIKRKFITFVLLFYILISGTFALKVTNDFGVLNFRDGFLVFPLIIIVGALAYSFYTYYADLIKIRSKIRVERNILTETLKIIFDLRKLYLKDRSAYLVELLIIDMRLKRIEFS